MPLASSTRLGPYEIVSFLGAGGMGEVYRARDTRLERTVALKLLQQGDTERLMREARAASALVHPNVAAVYDVARHEGVDFIVMEHVDGKTLDELIPKRGLRLNQVLHYGIQIAEALATAHARGIVHRDLKPGNIMVTGDGTVKLLDFGLARVQGSAAASEATRTVTAEGTVAGTVAYMSPEQAEGKPLDARTDIFSFGAVLYEMTTGRRAFAGDSPASTMSAVLRDEPKPASEVTSDVPRDLEKIIGRCLRKDPNWRLQSMADVKIALHELKQDSESGRLTPPIAPQTVRGRRWVLAPAAALAAIAIALAWWASRGRVETQERVFTPVPATSLPGNERQPTFSPDGNQFAYSGDAQGNYDIYVQVIGSGTPLRVTTSPANEIAPAWSPDGRQIAYLRQLDTLRYALMLSPPLGGAERKLTELQTAASILAPFYIGLTWTADSQAVLYSDETSDAHRIWMMDVNTGEKRPLTNPSPELQSDYSPAVSPDGKRFAFMRAFGTQVNELFVSDLGDARSGKMHKRQVTSGRAFTRNPVWINNDELVYSSGQHSRFSLYRVSAGGGAERQIPGIGAGAELPAVSSSRRLLYTLRYQDTGLWRLPLQAEMKPVAIAGSTYEEFSPDISRDGKRLAFTSGRSGNLEVWISNVDGSEARPLTSYGTGHSGSARWSPDGTRVAYDSNRDGSFNIYVVSADGGAAQQLTQSSAEDAIPSWSRDGKWIYFESNRTGRPEVFKVPSTGGTEVQVTTNGGFVAFESSDGKDLYYTKRHDGRQIFRRAIDGGTEELFVDGVAGRFFYAAPSGVYYVSDRALHHKPYRGGAARKLYQFERRLQLGLAVDPQEKFVIFSQFDREGSDLMLIENFR